MSREPLHLSSCLYLLARQRLQASSSYADIGTVKASIVAVKWQVMAAKGSCLPVFRATRRSRRYVQSDIVLDKVSVSLTYAQCNRSLPCNHCTQRRRPEDCIYNSSSELPVLTRGGRGRDIPTDLEPVALDIHVPKGPTGALDRHIGSLADLYGHVENSDFSIVGLVQRLGDSRVSAGAQVSAYWRQYTEHKFVKTDALEYAGSKTAETIAPDICDEIEQHFRALPDREVFDFLLDYYTKEVHW